MNILPRFTARSMKKNPIRTLVTLLGVILSAAMFTAVTTFAFSLWTFLKDSTISQTGDYHIRCDWLSREELSSLSEDPRITSLAQYTALGYLETQNDSGGPLSTFVVASGDEAYFESMPIRLSQGRYPENSGELLLHDGVRSILEHYGYETAIGQTLSLSLSRQCADYLTVEDPEGASPTYTAEYTIVGYIHEDVLLTNNGLDPYPLLTLADGEEGTALWYRAFVKTAPRQVWELIRGEEFHDIDVNETLLALYGQSRYENFTGILFWLSAVLCSIIVVGSVSLIYNSFSISLSERTKQFGLLSCIGATKKQLRRAVYAEALFLALPGIPIGALFGYGGISLTLYLLQDRLLLVLGDFGQNAALRGVLSPVALILGGLLTMLTLFLSATFPAKRATKITPLEAIRQTQDYAIPKRLRPARPSVFGLPAALAKSYYRVSKGKYRATLISLIVSLVVFLSATGFTAGLKFTADQAVNAENYDFSCYVSPEEGKILAKQDFVSASSYVTENYFCASIAHNQRSEEFLRYEEDIRKAYEQAVNPVADMLVYYLEDGVLEAYLKEHGLDPTEYLDSTDPKALVCYKEVTTYMMKDENGLYTRYTYHYPPLSSTVSSLTLFPYQAPDGLDPFGNEGRHSFGYTADEAGNPILLLTPYRINEQGHIEEDLSATLSYKIEWIQKADGSYSAAYYLIDKETGLPSHSPTCTEAVDLKFIPIGATVRELPLGIPQQAKDSPYYTSLILPLSAAPQELQNQGMLCFTTKDYTATKAYLRSELEDAPYTDHLEQEEAARAMVHVIDIFSYGFIVLICLICIANIFNTLSTNVALRRRDFGMLRSVGFRNKDLRKMLGYECLTYGTKALLWGLPLGLLANAGIQKIAADSGSIGYNFPTEAVIAAGCSVFIIVFTTMFYAASKLRKDNPIDAIRQECI